MICLTHYTRPLLLMVWAHAAQSLRVEPAQLGLNDLAVVVLGQLLYEAKVPSPFVSGNVIQAQSVENCRIDERARTWNDVGHRNLAPLRVGSGDHRYLGNVRVSL